MVITYIYVPITVYTIYKNMNTERFLCFMFAKKVGRHNNNKHPNYV